MDAMSYIEAAQERREKGGMVGATWGLPALDRRTGGIWGEKLIVVAGRPSVGKTAFALNAALSGRAKVGIISLEMGTDELGIRSIANLLDVNGTALSFADPHTLETTNQRAQNRTINDRNIWVDDSTYGLNQIVSRITEWRRKHDIDYAIVDHIGLIEGNNGHTRNDWLGDVSRTLKKTAKRLEMPIIALSQLNRAARS